MTTYHMDMCTLWCSGKDLAFSAGGPWGGHFIITLKFFLQWVEFAWDMQFLKMVLQNLYLKNALRYIIQTQFSEC